MPGLIKSEWKFFAPLGLSVVGWFSLAASSGAQEPYDVFLPDIQSFRVTSVSAPQTFTVPDGTQVQLRLAQPVRGLMRSIKGTRVYSKAGDKIRLVAADDVRVNGMVVISKGAVGQATIAKTNPPPTNTYSYNDRYAALADLFVPKTGSVVLQLDWVKDITGHAIPLRAYPAGEAKPFTMMVLAENGGIVARPPKFSQDMKLRNLTHEKPWAPAGTRLLGFVHGAVNFEPAELKDAQALLPIPNPTAMLTIFRGKGHRETQPHISCDDKEVVAVGEREFTTLDLAPGKHSCHTDGQPPLEFLTDAGEEYFVQTQYRTFSSVWVLKLMTEAEGEDSMSSLEPAPEKQPSNQAANAH